MKTITSPHFFRGHLPGALPLSLTPTLLDSEGPPPHLPAHSEDKSSGVSAVPPMSQHSQVRTVALGPTAQWGPAVSVSP